MKSRDEQALDMARVICPEAGTRKYVEGKCSKFLFLHCPARISIFEALIDAGYGDVAEYKAEIERLNEELKKPQEQFVQDEKDHEEENPDCKEGQSLNKKEKTTKKGPAAKKSVKKDAAE